MDGNNWRAAQGESNLNMDGSDWRADLPPDYRQQVVNELMDTEKSRIPLSGPDELVELKKMAVRFEEEIYTAAPTQKDYWQKISTKIHTMDAKSQASVSRASSLPSNSTDGNQSLPDLGSISEQIQVGNPAQQPLPIPMVTQSQSVQQIPPQNHQSIVSSSMVQNSMSLPPSMPSPTEVTQNAMCSIVGQNSNSLTSISGLSHNSASGSEVGQGVLPHIFANPQSQQLQGRHQGVPQQQSQNPQQQYVIYEQQLFNQKLHQGNIQPSLLVSHPQQQQQPLLQSSQMQGAQQSLTPSSPGLLTSQPTLHQKQTSMMQASAQSCLQQKNPSTPQSASSVIQQHRQSGLGQQQHAPQSSVYQQPTPMPQNQMLPPQPQLHYRQMGQQPSGVCMQQNELLGLQQNSVPEMQQQQFLAQKNNLSNLHNQQQQLLLGHKKHSLTWQQQQQQQQLGQQSNISGLQHQQQLCPQSNFSDIKKLQHSHILQQAKIAAQQQQQNQQMSSSLLSSQGQQNKSQTQQQMSKIQSLPSLLQQPNSLQREMHKRIQTSSALFQPQNAIQQQKQQFQSQRGLPEAPSTSIDPTAQSGYNAVDWQEEVYQKIKSMKDMYLRDLKEYYMTICWKIQNVDAISQGTGPLDQLTKLNNHRGLVDKLLCFLSVTRSNILPDHRDKVADVEKQIFDILNSSRLRKSTSSQQQPRNQTHQLLQHDNHGGQIQTVKARGSVTSGLLLSGSIPSSTHFGVPPTQYNVMRSRQPTTNPDSVQGNALGLRQQGMVGSLQQNMERGTQQTNNSTFSYCSGNAVEPNMNTLQQNSNVQQQQQQRQHLNQEEQQQKIMRSEQLKWFQQHHMHPQLIQQQNQLHQQQQQSQQMSQLHQMNNQVNGLKVRQGIGVNRPGILSQHHQLGSRSTSKYQQLKTGVPLSVSSPQLLQPQSPQISQQSSPQIEQQSFLSSLSRTGASLQAANSPFIATSPSTPMLTPSPVAGDPEKQNSCVSSIPEAGNLGHQQLGHSLSQAQFPAISTPGISASPLLAEFPSPEKNQGSVAEVLPGKSTATEQPVERLINAVKSTSANAMSSSMSDIGSVMSIVDRLSGSAPCYVSKAVIGKDLVAATKCRLQGRNFIPPGGNALAATMKLRRHISSLPGTAVSSVGNVNNDSFKGVSSLTSDLVSNGTSRIKRRRVETNHALLEEISDINQSLIHTVVEIGDEEFDSIEAAPKGKGTIVKCSFSAIAVSPNLRTQFSSQMAPILPLRLLVPVSYPNCAPVILDKVPVETSNEIEDLSDRAKSRFSTFLRGLSEPMSLGEMARTWDACARKAIAEYAQQSGGGTFSSIYGTWENCVGA